MKDNSESLLLVASPILMLVGVLLLSFRNTINLGVALFVIGAALGFVGAYYAKNHDYSHKFLLVSAFLGLAMILVFIFTGIMQKIVLVSLLLYALSFMLVIFNLEF